MNGRPPRSRGPRPAPSPRPAPPPRWFLAQWPDEVTCRALQAHQAAWTWPPRARPTPAAKLHLTLHFLGPLPEAAVAPLRAALAGVTAGPVQWTLQRPALWAQGVAVLEPARVPAAAAALHAALAEVLRAQGLPLEARPWRPHVTLARRAPGAVPPGGAPPLTWTARGFDLVCSHHGYHRVAHWPARR